MNTKTILSSLVLGTALLAITGCATEQDLQAYAEKEELQRYATKDDLSALRRELLNEIRKAQDSAAASAAAAQSAADDAAAASEKADAIFRKSLRK